MRTEQLVILQFIAHLLTDYTFQPPVKAREKNEYGFRSKFLKWHILLAFMLSWILSFQLAFVYAAFVIALTHWLIDGIKIHINRNPRFGKYAFFIDQSMHLIIIAVIVLFFDRMFCMQTVIVMTLNTKYLIAAAGFLLCSKPSNILIKEILGVFDIRVRKTGAEEAELPNAGKLIGTIERWLVIAFIMIGRYEVIGFLLAAKSIMRFKDDEALKTEYLLAGTMLSFGIAVGTGLLYKFM